MPIESNAMNPEYKQKDFGPTMREWLAYQHKQRAEWLNKIRKARR
jgi:hypothetical protein